jgi:hypothetical protein
MTDELVDGWVSTEHDDKHHRGASAYELRFSSVKTEHRTEQPITEYVGFCFFHAPIGCQF